MEIIKEKALKIIMLEKGMKTIMVNLKKEIFRLFMSIKAKNVLQLVFMIPITRSWKESPLPLITAMI